MTSSAPEPGSPHAGEAPDAFLQRVPVRLLTAWALLAWAAVGIAFGFLGWILPTHRADILHRFDPAAFTSVPVLAAPVLAALVALRLGPSPAPDWGRPVALVAMLEYLTALTLGTLAFLVTLTSRFDSLPDGFIYAAGAMVGHVGDIAGTLLRLGLLTLGLLWVYQLFTRAGGRLPGLGASPG